MLWSLIRKLARQVPLPAAPVDHHLPIGIKNLREGDFAAACRHLRAALAADSANVDVWYYLALAEANSGRLKDPIYHILSMVRALGGSISATNQSAWSFSRTGQTPMSPASVFSFYSPLFHAPKTALYSAAYRSAMACAMKRRLEPISLPSSGGPSACIQSVSARPSQNCQRE